MIDQLLTVFGLTKASVVTGAIGAFVAAVRGDPRPWWVRVLNFTVGLFVAAYGAGVVLTLFSLPDTPTFQGALGFTLGYLGMAIMEAAMVAMDAVKRLDFKALIESALKRVGIG